MLVELKVWLAKEDMYVAVDGKIKTEFLKSKGKRCAQTSFTAQRVSPSPPPPDTQVLPPLAAQYIRTHLFKHMSCSIPVIPLLCPSLKCKFSQEQRYHLRFTFIVKWISSNMKVFNKSLWKGMNAKINENGLNERNTECCKDSEYHKISCWLQSTKIQCQFTELNITGLV